MATTYPNYGRIDGPIVIIGFGSIGRGTLPLIERHFTYDPRQVYVIDPLDDERTFLEQRGVHFIHHAVTRENYRALLGQLFPDGRGFCVNLSVDTSSLELMRLARELGVLYVDTVVEPWAGHYFDLSLDPADRTNYALREAVRAEKRANPGGPTAVSCCGANPGHGLLAAQGGAAPPRRRPRPAGRGAARPRGLGAADAGARGQGRAHRRARHPGRARRQADRHLRQHLVGRGLRLRELPARRARLGHPRALVPAERPPPGARAARRRSISTRRASSPRSTPGRPAAGPQYGYLVTHNEAVSIADYFTIGEGDAPEFRPTCHYAYHPCDQAVLSLHETLGSGRVQETLKILDENEILWGADDLGVLLYGHERNALWYGSRLSIQEARALAPFQNATGLQVTSAVLAGMAWALANPRAGIVETEEMDHAFCLRVQRPYLGRIEAHYTDWTPISTRWPQFAEEIDESDPWQFENVLAT